MTARELGLARYKVRYRILEALEAEGVHLQDIACRVGVSYQAVRKVLRGESHSERILREFRASRVPEKYLYDPRRRGVRMRGCGVSVRISAETAV